MTLPQQLINDFDWLDQRTARESRFPRKSAVHAISSFDQLATRLHDDWRALLRTGANCVVTAPSHLLDEFESASREVLREPIQRLSGTWPLDPKSSQTIIIENVDRLTPAAQRTLGKWLNDPSHLRVQVIVLTSVSLFAMVEAEAFDANLFYRLNVIHLNLDESI